jgi:peptide/nickel transport system permease protein
MASDPTPTRAPAPTPTSTPTSSPVHEKAAYLRRYPKLWAGLIIVGLFAVMAVIGPLLAGNPNAVSYSQLAGPSAEHLLGTTNTGQDVFSQLLVGARGSLAVGLLVGVLATAVSTLIGMIGGMAGGLWDEGVSLLSNIFLVIPGLPLVILITDYVHTTGVLPIAIVIAITSWAGGARVVRAQTLSLRRRDYVDAARVSGESHWRILVFEVLPNLAPIVTSQFVFGVLGGILAEAGLSFLGLGNIDSITWGSMLYFAQNGQALSLGAWWWFVPPGLCIALIGTGLTLINLGIDEVVNPRLRKPGGRRTRRLGRGGGRS